MINAVFKKKLDYWLLLVLVLPNLIWVLLDRSLWGSDPSLFGWQANFISSHLNNPEDLWNAMMSITPKPPILPWLGIIFAPIGRAIGHPEVGLLLPMIGFQYLALVFLYKSLNLALSDRKLALIGCLMLAASPLFLKMGTRFYVQMPLVFVVNWFIYLMLSAPRQRSVILIIQLIAVSSIGMLSKVSAPLLVVIPGLVICWEIHKRPFRSYSFHRADILYTLLALLPLVLATYWYQSNFESILAYTKVGFNYQWDGIYASGYISKLWHWFSYLLLWLGLTGVILVLVSIFLVAKRKSEKIELKFPSIKLIVTVVLLEVIVNLLVFASSLQQQDRYLLPLVSYIIILTCAAIYYSHSNILRKVATITMVCQFIVVQAISFYILTNTNYKQREVAEQISQAIVNNPDHTYLLITAEQEIFHTNIQFLASQYSDEIFTHSTDIQSLEFLLTDFKIAADINKGLDSIKEQSPDFIFLTSKAIRKAKSKDLDKDGLQWQDIMATSRVISDSIDLWKDYGYYPIEELDPSVYTLKRAATN